MMKSPLLLGSAALAALIGAMAATTVARGAATPSSPAEQAATVELNRKIAEGNAAEEARAKAQQAQYDEQLKQQKAQYEEQLRAWEKQQQEYLAQQKKATGAP